MALTVAQVDQVNDLAAEYDAAESPLSFADYLRDRGEAPLLAELVATLEAAGDTESLAAIETVPERPRTPESIWQEYVGLFDAPLEGGPWALNSSGKWFEVSTQAPGGRVGTYQGRSIYVPPAHPDGAASEAQLFPGNTSPELRFTDQKFRMARAAILQDDPKALWYDLFFRVAPRGGGPFGSGLAWYDDGAEYTSEGGERWPDLKPDDPIAKELDAWWRSQDFGHHFPGQGPGNPLSWLRVYTDPEGFQRYKAWSHAEIREFLFRYMLGVNPGVVCTPEELNGYLAGIWTEQETRWHVAHNDRSSFWPFPLTPFSFCDSPTQRRHKKVIRALSKAVALAGIIWLGVMFGPVVFAKMKTVMAAMAPRLKDAIAQRAASPDAADPAQAEATRILSSPETQAAIARGELPPPPTSTADPAFQDYAAILAQWYMQRQLEEQRASIADPQQRAAIAESDARLLAESESLIRAEVARATREAERVAAGVATEDEAAASFLSGDSAKWLAFGAAGLAAAIYFGGNRNG